MNIVLDYPVKIYHRDSVFFARSCEVFLDEHNVQWVKFKARNGPSLGNEHMVRTDQVLIVRTSYHRSRPRIPDSAAP